MPPNSIVSYRLLRSLSANAAAKNSVTFASRKSPSFHQPLANPDPPLPGDPAGLLEGGPDTCGVVETKAVGAEPLRRAVQRGPDDERRYRQLRVLSLPPEGTDELVVNISAASGTWIWSSIATPNRAISKARTIGAASRGWSVFKGVLLAVPTQV